MRRRLFALLMAAAFLGLSAIAVITVLDMRRTWKGSAACSVHNKTVQQLSLLSVLLPDIKWTAYAQSAPVAITAHELPLTVVEADVLAFLGAPDRIAFFKLASGRLPLDGELGECALDAGTAFALFQSTDAGGGSVRVDGEVLRVVGVIDVDQSLVLTPADNDDELVRLVADDRDALIALASALGVEPDPFELSGWEVVNLMWLACAAPWLMTAALALGALRRSCGWRRTAGSALACALAVGVLMALLVSVPVRLLPARWSDLAFYGKQVAEFTARPFRQMDARDALLKADALRTGLLCAGACVALMVARRCVDKSAGLR